MYRTQIRNILGLFKFSDDDIQKKTGIISGGEKARVSLAKILVSPVNFLLMDEPTNHLDLDSKKQLEKALRDYDGTLLIISHDRYFLDQLVSIVFELKNGRLKRYEGNYSDYLIKRDGKPEQHPASAETNSVKSSVRRDKLQKRMEAEARQKISNQRQILNKQINDLEQELQKLEEEKREIEQEMSNPSFYKDQARAAETGKHYQDLLNEIPSLYQQWENKQTELENLLAGLNDE
jgi:ATP-binding cassette subfamily F protein 3